MQNLIVILIIASILYLAVRPIIKLRKQKGSGYTCYRCSYNKDGECGKHNQC